MPRLPRLRLLLLLTLPWTGCGSKDGAPVAAFSRPPPAVVVASAVAENVPLYLDEIGRCTARESVNVQPQVSGRIMGIHFVDGADLTLGKPLFTIDPRPYQAQLAQANASLRVNQAALDLAKLEVKRYESLMRSHGGVSRETYDQKANAVQVAEAQVASSLATIESARLNVEFCTIKSPIEGRAGHRLVDVGNIVLANNKDISLLTIQRLDPIYADFTVAENDFTAVQANARKAQLKVEVSLPEKDTKSRSGEVTFLDNSVQELTGNVKLRATLPNADRHFWPGRFVKVRLILRTLPNAVLVPAEAVQLSAKGSFVYVVKPDDTAELRLVTTGQKHDDRVVLLSGVKAKERVITVGQIAVMPGGKVRVETSPASSPSASGKAP
jgi:multidrug efflux system membrane fusion protein